MSCLYHLIYFTQQLQAGGKTLETGALSTLLRGDGGVKVSSDGPWEEGSNGNHVAAGRRGFAETHHHHPGSLGKLFPEPCAPREWLLPKPPPLPSPLPTPKPTPGFPALAFGAALLVMCFLASVHFSHQLYLCVSVIAGLQKHVVHIMLTQSQL